MRDVMMALAATARTTPIKAVGRYDFIKAVGRYDFIKAVGRYDGPSGHCANYAYKRRRMTFCRQYLSHSAVLLTSPSTNRSVKDHHGI